MPTIIENRVLKSISGNNSRVAIPEGVTAIGEHAFRDCFRLTQITIPEGVTKIGDNAFFKCIDLTQINIPDNVTLIGSGAFAGCSSLTQINMPDSVTEIDKFTFYNCTRLTQINIPNSVTLIDNSAFRGCSSLTQINIPEGVTEIGLDVFERCAFLQRIVVRNNNEAARVKACLPDVLKDKVTSYYLQHQQNIKNIRHSQLALSSSERLFNVFQSSLINRDVTGFIYLFLSFQDIITLSCIYTGLKPIKDIAQSINTVRYKGIIPGFKPTSDVKTSFLEQYTPNNNDKELTDYHRLLIQYKLNLRKSISATLSESKSNNNNNNNEEQNNRRMLCRLP